MLNKELIKVAEHTNLVRDSYTNAIIDVDKESYERYIKAKERRLAQSNQIGLLEDRINTIDSDISEIKQLLYKMLESQNGHHN